MFRPQLLCHLILGWGDVQSQCGAKAAGLERDGQSPRRPHAGVNTHIDRPVSDDAGHKREKGERKERAEHFKMKGGLQAVRGTSGEKKRSERFRQTLQTGTLPGVFQEMYLNVFC